MTKEKMRQRVREAKSQVILELISQEFEELGYQQLTMQSIAKKAGISVGALYKLFSSKEELFYAYIQYQIHEFHQELIRASASLSHPKERLELFVEKKLFAFESKRKAIEDPLLGDPLFFVKMNSKQDNPTQPILDFLATNFRELDREEHFLSKDFMKTAYLFNAYTMGYIEYSIVCHRPIDEPSKEIVSQFLATLTQAR